MPSMGSVGDAYNNALAEAFFATLETELLMSPTVFKHPQTSTTRFRPPLAEA